jgi:hypothetical protein
MRIYCGGFVVLMGVASFAADVTPLDVKAGEWETTMVMQGAGPAAAAIRPETLARMSPEQRAQMEAALKEAGKPTTSVARKCIKKEDLSQPLALGPSRPNCKANLVSSSRTKQEVHMECAEKGATSVGTVHVEAANPETIKFDMQITTTLNGRSSTITSNATSKWIGATCTEKQ